MPEALAALSTEERLLARVRTHVNVQLTCMHKALLALRAGVWFHPRVDALVLLQAVVPAESFATVRTQVQLVPLPKAGVVLKTSNCTKGLGALRTTVLFGGHCALVETNVFGGHLWVVAADVLVQVALSSE